MNTNTAKIANLTLRLEMAEAAFLLASKYYESDEEVRGYEIRLIEAHRKLQKEVAIIEAATLAQS